MIKWKKKRKKERKKERDKENEKKKENEKYKNQLGQTPSIRARFYLHARTLAVETENSPYPSEPLSNPFAVLFSLSLPTLPLSERNFVLDRDSWPARSFDAILVYRVARTGNRGLACPDVRQLKQPDIHDIAQSVIRTGWLIAPRLRPRESERHARIRTVFSFLFSSLSLFSIRAILSASRCHFPSTTASRWLPKWKKSVTFVWSARNFGEYFFLCGSNARFLRVYFIWGSCSRWREDAREYSSDGKID